MTTTHEARMAYERLIEMVGPGFHPDTPGHGYEALPEGVTPEGYDAVVQAAADAGLDLYEIALRTVQCQLGV